MNEVNALIFPGPRCGLPDPDTELIQSERAKAPTHSDAEFSKVFGPWTNWLIRAAEVKSAPVDFVALALLSVASAVIGNTRWVSPWADWCEPPIIWGMAVGDPSSGKSPAMDAVLDAIKQIDAACSRKYAEERASWEETAELAKLVEAQWKAETKEALRNGEEPGPRPKAANPGPHPIRKRIRVTDTTVEKAGELMRDIWRSLLLFRDELIGHHSSMNRYSNGGEEAFWLEVYGGRAFTIDRKNSPEPIIVDHMSIAILGGTQPEKLDKFLSGGVDDGMMARYLVAFPDPVPLTRPTSNLDMAFIQNALERLYALEPEITDDGEKKPILVRLDEEAQEVFHELRGRIREMEAKASGMFKSHIGKMQGHVLRVALVLALLDAAADDIGHGVETISASHIDRAILYVSYLHRHAERAYGAAAMPPERLAANRIADIILKDRLDQVSTRDIQRRGLAGLQTSKEIGPAFAVLETGNWIRQLPSKGPGRPSKTYVVNPKVKDLR